MVTVMMGFKVPESALVIVDILLIQTAQSVWRDIGESPVLYVKVAMDMEYVVMAKKGMVIVCVKKDIMRKEGVLIVWVVAGGRIVRINAQESVKIVRMIEVNEK